MDSLISLYQQRLNLPGATFTLIDHEDAMVATVYKITQPPSTPLILKICTRTPDYLREVYFLNYFVGKIPVPRIVQIVQPEKGVPGAILMECLPGTLLTEFTDSLAYEMGSVLARIHLNRTPGYGDLIEPNNLSSDPRVPFTQKFDEGLAECAESYFKQHISLLSTVDGPCIVHRDFRPGNTFVNNGKLEGIIDWSSAKASFSEEDFCPMEHSDWPCKRAFLAGYASVRTIPDYEAVMPLLRLSKAIATVGFTIKQGTWNRSHARLYQRNLDFLKNFSY
ncbi:MAG: phosphotransferase [Candidatus Melainabacteria bacterium]|nr:phosphotransferase [Candidatus Melainabacteria bacterium]